MLTSNQRGRGKDPVVVLGRIRSAVAVNIWLYSNGVEPEEAEEVVETASGPYPQRLADDKLLVWGPGRGGRLLQVVFVLDDDGTAFVIHGRELTNREKSVLRRKRRQ
jgi:hypothetical protein